MGCVTVCLRGLGVLCHVCLRCLSVLCHGVFDGFEWAVSRYV